MFDEAPPGYFPTTKNNVYTVTEDFCRRLNEANARYTTLARVLLRSTTAGTRWLPWTMRPAVSIPAESDVEAFDDHLWEHITAYSWVGFAIARNEYPRHEWQNVDSSVLKRLVDDALGRRVVGRLTNGRRILDELGQFYDESQMVAPDMPVLLSRDSMRTLKRASEWRAPEPEG